MGVNDNVHRSHRTHRQLAGRTQPHAASPNNTRPRRASRHTGLSQCNACASLYCHHDQRLQPTPVRVYGASARPQRIPAPAPIVLLPPTTTRPSSPGRVTPPCRIVGACHSGAICHVSSGKLAPPPPTHISISSPTRNRLAPQTQTQTHTRTHNRMPSVRSSRIPVAFETPIRHSIAATAPARSDRVECAMIRTAVLPLHRALIRSRSRAGPWRGA